jgi:predicted acyltransferase
MKSISTTMLPFMVMKSYIDSPSKRWLRIFSVVGTNSIFIYLLAETVGIQWFRDFGKIFTHGLLAPIGAPEDVVMVVNALFVLFMFWYITYFLDKKKVYFKI